MTRPPFIRRIVAGLTAAAALLAAYAGPAHAADTTTFNVTITILKACAVDAAAPTDVAFGSIASTATNVDAAGNLSVRCTPLTPYKIRLNKGQNGADINSRAMANGSDTVPYQLYRDAARNNPWGETDGVDTYGGTGDGATQVIPVYGRVPSANYPAQAYTDTVTATIVY